MPFDGAGGFIALDPPTYPAVAGEVIYAARFNAVMQDIFDALALVVARDGQSSITGNMNFNAFKIIGLAAAAAAGQAVEYQQWLDSFTAPVFGTPRATTPALGDTSTLLATTAYVQAQLASAAAVNLPPIVGRFGSLQTDGVTTFWGPATQDFLLTDRGIV